MEWISVHDKMPPIDTKVFVCNKDNGATEAFFISTGELYYFCIGQDVKQSWDPDYWALPPKE
jgi:hypothetical protein